MLNNKRLTFNDKYLITQQKAYNKTNELYNVSLSILILTVF